MKKMGLVAVFLAMALCALAQTAKVSGLESVADTAVVVIPDSVVVQVLDSLSAVSAADSAKLSVRRVTEQKEQPSPQLLAFNRTVRDFRKRYDEMLERWDDIYLIIRGIPVKSDYYKLSMPATYYHAAIEQACNIDGWKPRIPFLKDDSVAVRPFPLKDLRRSEKIDRYINTRKLVRLRERVLVDMDFHRKTESEHIWKYCDYDISEYKQTMKTRWDPYKDEPMQNAAALCYTLRRIVNSAPSRIEELKRILDEHPKAIVFYNFDYERALLIAVLDELSYPYAEWSGHAHQEIPDNRRKWVYLVQYTAGCEGWNCINTDTTIFFSQNYSYKVMEQAAGRIDRLNTPFERLYFYHLSSKAPIDRAITQAVETKKIFNERRFVKW